MPISLGAALEAQLTPTELGWARRGSIFKIYLQFGHYWPADNLKTCCHGQREFPSQLINFSLREYGTMRAKLGS